MTSSPRSTIMHYYPPEVRKYCSSHLVPDMDIISGMMSSSHSGSNSPDSTINTMRKGLRRTETVYSGPFGNYAEVDLPTIYLNNSISVSDYNTAQNRSELIGFSMDAEGPDGALLNQPVVRQPQRLKSHTQCERILLALLFIVCLILLGVVIAFIVVAFNKKSVCTSRECVWTAASLLESVDFRADPCEDFYQYACGRWELKHDIPPNDNQISNFQNQQKNVDNNVKELLIAKTDYFGGSAVQKAKDFYQLCINKSEVIDSWKRFLESKFKGWPLNIRHSSKSLHELLAPIDRSYRNPQVASSVETANALFKLDIDVNSQKPSQFQLKFSYPDSFLASRHHNESVHKNKKMIGAYKTLMQNIMTELPNFPKRGRDKGDDDVAEEIKKFADNNFELEKEIGDMVTECRLDPEIEARMSLGDFIANVFPNIQGKLEFDTMKYFETYYDFQGVKSDTKRIQKEDEIIVENPCYFKELNKWIRKKSEVQETSAVVNFIYWRWFSHFVLVNLPDPYEDHLNKYNRVIQGTSCGFPRDTKCAQLMNQLAGFATGAMYVKKHFDKDAKIRAEKMIERLMTSIHIIIKSEKWLSEETRKAALIKANNIEKLIGYPEWLVNEADVDNYYKDYKVMDDFFLTKENFIETNYGNRINKFDHIVNRTDWSTLPATVNAFYSPDSNTIILPAGILQPVFYHKDYPKSLNYGGIGVVIGHEITHGFDTKGKQYDEWGKKINWWSASTEKEFAERANCIREQYSNYTLEQIGLKINGNNTLPENIADNGGLTESFQAYRAWVRDNGEEQRLPGINLTHNQLFFLNYAQIWCGKMNDEIAEAKIKEAPHSPGSIRVLGPLSNSPDFTEAYQCRSGARMNPSNRCKVW